MSEAVKFGTSGLRGPADRLAQVAADYALAFLAHLEARQGRAVAALGLGRDLRASSPLIAMRVTQALIERGVDVLDCGELPTPALAHFALGRGVPAIMVTGSHIPADRNGLKFFTATGEITKADEAGIASSLGAARGPARAEAVLRDTGSEAAEGYWQRCRSVLSPGQLRGLRVGIFEHSSVLRDGLAACLQAFGAEAVPLGRSEAFVPVDTEAPGDPVFAPLPGWVAAHRLDALVSADADGDRPLLLDETGDFVRGDALGAIAARALDASAVAVPVTANSALEAALAGVRVERTRVGSPYVIAAMEAMAGNGTVAGFEANGGLMLGTSVARFGLTALPTRDAVLPLLLALGEAARRSIAVSALVHELGLRPARAGRIADMAPGAMDRLVSRLADPRSAAPLLAPAGPIIDCDGTDGLRFSLAGEQVIHFRPSGNAPEMRCYTEAPSDGRADKLLVFGLDLITRWRDHGI